MRGFGSCVDVNQMNDGCTTAHSQATLKYSSRRASGPQS